MFLVLEPTTIQMRSAFGSTDGRDGSSFSFSLEMSGQDQLELKTGEVFESPRLLKIRGNSSRAISATLGIIPTSADEDFRANEMRYFEKYESEDFSHPASIHFTVFIHDREMQQVVANIRAGMLPTAITVHLLHKLFDGESPISYGWAPDGSMKVWNNADKNNHAVAIRGIEFSFDIMKDRDNSDDDLSAANPSTKLSNSSDALLTRKIDSLTERVANLSRSLTFAAIAAVVVFYFSR